MNPKRILVVDDEPSVILMLEACFEESGMEITSARSAEEALIRLPADRFDFLLVDKNLPGMSGVDLIRSVRGEGSNVPIVMMTAFASAESAAETLSLGISAYLDKPFRDVFKVVELVRDLLAKNEGKTWVPGLYSSGGPQEFAATLVGPRLEVLVASNDEMAKAAICAPLREVANASQVTGVSADILAAIAKAMPDLVVIDSAHCDAAVVPLVQEVIAVAPSASVAVLSTAPLPLSVVQSLITLGVTGLFGRQFDAAWEKKFLGMVRTLQAR